MVEQLALGLFTGLASLGKSPQQEAFEKLLAELDGKTDYLGERSFDKDELFQGLLPMIQDFYRGGADIAASKIGASVGEANANVGGGQNYQELFTQALSPVIAEGEFKSGEAVQRMIEVYNSIDDAAKKRLLSAEGLKAAMAQGLDNMHPLQKFFVSFLQGADIGGDIMGNMAMANFFNNKQIPNDPSGGSGSGSGSGGGNGGGWM